MPEGRQTAGLVPPTIAKGWSCHPLKGWAGKDTSLADTQSSSQTNLTSRA